MIPVVVALGSNLPPRRETLLSGVRALAHLPDTRLLATSALRETAPLDAPPGSGPFLNGAVLLHTTLTPRELLERLQDIERAHGRARGAPNAPRTLDLDLILYGELQLHDDDLIVPHPRAHERDFVLEPAADVAGSLRHPGLDRTLAQLRDARRAGAASETPASGTGGAETGGSAP